MTTDFRRIALAAAIAIVATILVAMTSRAIFPSPVRPSCEERIVRPPDSEETVSSEERAACEAEIDAFETESRESAKNQFFVLLIGSVVMVVLGGFVYSIPVISSGILWGGVVSLIFSLFFSFQPGIEDYYRLLAAVVAFVILLALAYRLFGKERIPSKPSKP